MPERTEYSHGTPSWVDLQTTDQDAAKTFYSGLFGWKYDDMPAGPGVVYSMAKLRDHDVCAIAPLGDQAAAGVPPHWNSYVTVTDVDASAAGVPDAGGTVIAPPFDVMDAGRMAVVADPTGAMLCLWTPKNSIGATLVNEAGAFSWTELITPDVPKAAAFYKKIFGWDIAPTPDGSYNEWKLDGESVGGAMNPPMPMIPTMWSVYFLSDDVDATAQKAGELGGNVMQPPTDIEPGRFSVIVDPQGAVFNVMTMKAGTIVK